MRVRGWQILTTLAVLLLALVAVASGAERTDVDVTIRINQLTATFASGHVFSNDKDCRSERLVYVYQVQPGLRGVRVATAKTRQNGSWMVHTALAPGQYFATAPRHRVGDTDCRLDITSIHSLPAPPG